MERKEIRERVEKILLKHEENTSEGSIYWDFEWVGGKRIPTGGGGYRQEGGEAVYADKAFYEEMTDFISQELDKAREEGREELLDSIVVGIEQLKSIVTMFNPMSTEIRAKQSGEIEAYDRLLEKLSKLNK